MIFDSPHVRWSPYFYTALMALALVAFWPGYLAVPKSELSGWTHFHAAAGTLWIIMLIVQPRAIRSGRRTLHIWLGRISFLLVPLVIVGFVGLAHSSMQGKVSARASGRRIFLLYSRCTCIDFRWILRYGNHHPEGSRSTLQIHAMHRLAIDRPRRSSYRTAVNGRR